MKILLDSTIIIDHFNNVSKAHKFLRDHRSDLFLSVITRAESLVGLQKEFLATAKQFLNFFPILNMTAKDADLAAEFRHTEKWKLPDAIQAALACNHSLKLATRNSKDFSHSKHKFVMIPYYL